MDLIKEAIADAKAVKQLATKNAIKTLTEAFAPQLQSIVSKKLAEEDEAVEDEEDLDLEAPIAEVDDDTMVEPEAEVPVEDEEEDLDLDEIMAELDAEDTDEDPLMEEEDEEPVEDEIEEPVEDEIDEIIGEVEGEMEEPVEDEIDEALFEEEDCEDEKPAMQAENRKLRRKLKEAYSAISKQKRVIDEIGNLNYKLLFTTKLFGKFDLNEGQKMKILEQFDRAKTEREIKLVYTTISEGLLRNSKKKRSTPMTESFSSKSVKAVAKPTNSNALVEIARMQHLAGIKK